MTNLISLNCLKSFAWVFFINTVWGSISSHHLFNYLIFLRKRGGGNVNQLPCACFVIVHFTFVVVGGWTVQCTCILLLVLVIYVEGTVEHLVWGLWCLTPLSTIFQLSWLSVLLVEETGDNHRPATSHWQILSYNVVSSTARLSGIRTHNISGDIYWLHR